MRERGHETSRPDPRGGRSGRMWHGAPSRADPPGHPDAWSPPRGLSPGVGTAESNVFRTGPGYRAPDLPVLDEVGETGLRRLGVSGAGHLPHLRRRSPDLLGDGKNRLHAEAAAEAARPSTREAVATAGSTLSVERWSSDSSRLAATRSQA